ncbi:MAG: 3-oxoacyl-[acyl-carrier-protein] reductase [Sphingomonadaceae bacterium]|nr:3-oxoacyl-[acyl-carrier-protein] reductase [Sphingomonadaceae bacterium]
MQDLEAISADVVDAALRLNRDLGPGLLESVCETVLAEMLARRGYAVARQRPVDIEYDGMRLECAFRIDLLVEDCSLVEIKSVERLNAAHAKQLLTYLRLTRQPLGLLINFGGETLKEGHRRIASDYTPFAPSRESRIGNRTMFDLQGKTALVTGASGGIGSAIAKALAERGARLAVSGSNGEKLESFRLELGGDHVALQCDLSDGAAVDQLVPRGVEALGGLDILVNNAGVTRDNLAMRMKDEEWDQVIRVNLEAAFRLCRAAMRPMMKARGGRIITITSVVGATGNPGQANYAASKAGLVGMSKALAQEVASRGITVNCVAPGFIASAMTEALPEAQRDALLGRIPAGRLGEGDDVAAAVVYLASDEAAYVTGQTLHVNGGMAML